MCVELEYSSETDIVELNACIVVGDPDNVEIVVLIVCAAVECSEDLPDIDVITALV